MDKHQEEEAAEETVFKAHKRVFGFECTFPHFKQLVVYIDEIGMEEQLVIHALEKARAMSSQYSFKLVLYILERYRKQAVLTVTDAIEFDRSQY